MLKFINKFVALRITYMHYEYNYILRRTHFKSKTTKYVFIMGGTLRL
jgi:hypothetical protein